MGKYSDRHCFYSEFYQNWVNNELLKKIPKLKVVHYDNIYHKRKPFKRLAVHARIFEESEKKRYTTNRYNVNRPGYPDYIQLRYIWEHVVAVYTERKRNKRLTFEFVNHVYSHCCGIEIVE